MAGKYFLMKQLTHFHCCHVIHIFDFTSAKAKLHKSRGVSRKEAYDYTCSSACTYRHNMGWHLCLIFTHFWQKNKILFLKKDANISLTWLLLWFIIIVNFILHFLLIFVWTKQSSPEKNVRRFSCWKWLRPLLAGSTPSSGKWVISAGGWKASTASNDSLNPQVTHSTVKWFTH